MSKSILVLSSSPRRGGNSDLLCDHFISGAKEAGHPAEKIFLKDKKINYCTGCGTCIDRKKRCPQKDDMADILEKMITADSNKKAMDRTLEEFRGFTYCLTGAKEKGIIYGTGAWGMGEIKSKPAVRQAYEAGSKV